MPSTPILSSAVNNDFSDIATALTNSVASDGQTTITGALKGYAGSEALPSYSFSNDLDTGMWRSGANTLAWSVGAAKKLELSSTGLNLVSGAFMLGGVPIMGLPIGALFIFGGSSLPPLCVYPYGQALSRSTYSALFTAYGTAYGSGDGSTTFNVQDIRSRSVFGRDDMGGSAANRITVGGGNFNATVLGASGGAQNKSLSSSEGPTHSHTINDPTHAHQTYASSTGEANQIGPNATQPNYNPAQTTGSSATNISINNSGSGTAFSILSNAFIQNICIFAGA